MKPKSNKIKLDKKEIAGIFIVIALFLILTYMIFIADAFAGLSPSPDFSPPELKETTFTVKGGGSLKAGDTVSFIVREDDRIIYSIEGNQDTITITSIEPDRIRYISTKTNKEIITLLNSAESIKYPEANSEITLFVNSISDSNADITFSTWNLN